ncbi:RNA-binding protein [Schizosaccharomyces japonicus yFS275]|uniref:RNA-binding protein n=1 Tax=Schizosaccharomyces japonicus (strain yFS275 / FY16936) TaxID=402676 RepID=B6K0X0_SCHJY|nr:RNA-binding protein [Schizosaccharomyces japonicus yFS275]EEB07591.1 RNA-binding protein [Schizosaccharomyces japonicus yFS275]
MTRIHHQNPKRTKTTLSCCADHRPFCYLCLSFTEFMIMNSLRKRSLPTSEDFPYIVYGVPLAPKHAVYQQYGSHPPSWLQEARDESGRKRFHGAFTGGFSAGYFNTVGSKEGWTPSSWSSSRTNRASVANAPTLEDIMDEEDLADRDASLQFIPRQPTINSACSLDDPLLRELTTSSNSFCGEKLLRQMGWNGQTFVGRRDIPVFPQDMHAYHGLGYAEDKTIQRVKATRIQSNVLRKRDPDISLGALNNEEEEDADIYDTGPPINVHYDKALTIKKPKPVLSNSLPTIRHAFIKKKSKSNVSLVSTKGEKKVQAAESTLFPGFVTRAKPFMLSITSHSTLPDIPADWQPKYLRYQKLKCSSASESLPIKELRADERGRRLEGDLNTHEKAHKVNSQNSDWRLIDSKTAQLASERPDHPYEDERKPLYDKFLQAHLQDDSSLLSGMSAVLLSEFMQTASLYRPLSAIMGNRFVSATMSKSDESKQLPTTDAPPKKFLEPSRIVTEFIPESLLCKRFGVPLPNNAKVIKTSEAKRLEPTIMSYEEEQLQQERPQDSIYEAIFGN